MVKTATVVTAAAVAVGAGILAATLLPKVKPPPPPPSPGGGQNFTVDVINGLQDPQDGASVTLGGVGTQQTNFMGQAVFSNVSEGTYPITVSLGNWNTYSGSVDVSASSTYALVTLQCGLTASSCACSQVLDNALCECTPIIPTSIVIPSPITLPVQWMVLLGCEGQGVCASVYPGNPGQCGDLPPGYLQGINTVYSICKSEGSFYYLQVTGMVEDAKGNPVCNQLVNISVPQTTFQWNSNDNIPYGTFNVTYPPWVRSGSDGSFTIDFPIQIKVAGYNKTNFDGACLGIPGFSSNIPTTERYDIVVNFSFPNSSSYTSLIIAAQMLICDYLV